MFLSLFIVSQEDSGFNLTSYNGIFIFSDKNNKFFFAKSIFDDDGSIQIIIPKWAYEIESLNKENKRINIEDGHFSELNYPFTIKPNFSTLGSVIEISTQGQVVTFVPDDSIRDLLGFNKTTIYNDNNLSINPVDILSFNNIFLECDIAQRMIFKRKGIGIIQNWIMTVDPG